MMMTATIFPLQVGGVPLFSQALYQLATLANCCREPLQAHTSTTTSLTHLVTAHPGRVHPHSA